MLAWETIDSAQVPGSSVMLRLMRRGEEFAIWVDGRPLMTSREHGSEDALAKLVCSRVAYASAEHPPDSRGIQRRPHAVTRLATSPERELRQGHASAVPSSPHIRDKRRPGAVDSATRTAPCLLVGGLGMGFTLAAALGNLPADAVVEVAELVPQVVEWNRGPLAHLAGFPLEDPRVVVHQADVAEVLRNRGCQLGEASPGSSDGSSSLCLSGPMLSVRPSASAPATILLRPSYFALRASKDKSGFEGRVDHRPSTIARYDAILLDVDNGPKSLSTPANSWLYSPDGVRTAAATLRPGGFLAVWSAGPDASFTNRLRKCDLHVEEVLVRSRGPKGGCHHTVWLARRSS